jgi:hypothetical protein
MCSWLRRPIFRTSTSGGTSTRWMNAPRGARARAPSPAGLARRGPRWRT